MLKSGMVSSEGSDSQSNSGPKVRSAGASIVLSADSPVTDVAGYCGNLLFDSES